MKIIFKSSKTISLKIKLFFAIALFSLIASFYLNLKFNANFKKVVAELNYSKKIISPQCSVLGGFHKQAFTIELTSNQPDWQIYYTTDGSEPNLESELYIKPITIINRSEESNKLSVIPTSPRWKPPINNVFKGTVLRAISVDKNQNKSNELVRTFFVDEKGNDRYSFPIVSITVNEKDLFGYKKGIYVLGNSYADKDNYAKKNVPLYSSWWYYPANYLSRGNNAERPAHLEFFEPNGKLGFESDIGIRINGNATRGFAQKSLRICFREKYGKAEIDYPIFPGNDVTHFSSFILRNSGNDWDKTMFRDAFMQSLMKNSHLDIQDYRPSIVFINGEYWGIHNIRERLDQNYLANKYQINPDSVSILEFYGNEIKGEKNAEKEFYELLNFIKKADLSIQRNYDYVDSQIDIKSFEDFVISNIYFCNSDWPSNNGRFWKCNFVKQKENDILNCSKWKWMLFDTDFGFGYTSKNAYEMNLLVNAKSEGSLGTIFSALLKNKTFSNEFILVFQNYINTKFKAENTINRINEFEKIYSPEMQEHIERWRAIGTYSNWEEYIEELREFATKRPAIQIKQLNDF